MPMGTQGRALTGSVSRAEPMGGVIAASGECMTGMLFLKRSNFRTVGRVVNSMPDTSRGPSVTTTGYTSLTASPRSPQEERAAGLASACQIGSSEWTMVHRFCRSVCSELFIGMIESGGLFPGCRIDQGADILIH